MKNKWLILFLVLGFLFITGCKEKNKSVKLSKENYVIGEQIEFSLENYESLDEFHVSFDTTYGVKTNDDGTFTARRVGNYKATLQLKEDLSIFYELSFSVFKSSFQLDSTTSTLAVGDKSEVWVYDFTDLYETKEDDFIYSVDNENLATISNGVLTAKNVGTVTVTATSKYNNNVTGSMKIGIGKTDTDFMIRPTKELAKIQIGEILPFSMSMNENPSDFEWLCDDKEIARVTKYDTKVEVSGVKEGKAYIICYKKSDPTVSARYLVTVEGEIKVDYRKRLIDLAFEQIGIKEGLKPNGSYDNDTKFGRWYGNNGEPWCATFVSWCWYHAGLSNDLLLKYQGCSAGKAWCEEQGIFKYKEDYTPTTGDIVFFLSAGAGHTGIVAHCDGTYIYTIEGNRSNRVDVWRIKLTNATITGYGVPNYPGLEEYDNCSWIKEKQADGTYLWHDVTSGDSTT